MSRRTFAVLSDLFVSIYKTLIRASSLMCIVEDLESVPTFLVGSAADSRNATTRMSSFGLRVNVYDLKFAEVLQQHGVDHVKTFTTNLKGIVMRYLAVLY